MPHVLGVWVHAWDVADVGAEAIAEELSTLGFTHVSMCARYVEERQCWPGPNILFRNPRRLTYTSEESPFYWPVGGERYSKLPPPLRPRPSREYPGDVVGEFIEAARSAGLKAVLWLPVLRFEAAVREDPSLAAVDVWGSVADYKRLFLCPSRREVRDFVVAVVEDLLSRYDFDELELDYIRYPKPPVTYAYPKAVVSMLACLCPSCVARAKSVGIDTDELIGRLRAYGEEVREFLNKAPTYPSPSDMDFTASLMADLTRSLAEDPVVIKWLEFRASLIEEVVALIRDKVKELNPKVTLSADLYPPSASWIVGQDYRRLGKLLDRVKTMLYTRQFGASPSRIPYEVALGLKQLRGCGADLAVGVGSWPPATVGDVVSDAEAALRAGAHGIYLYSYGWTPQAVLHKVAKLLSGSLRGVSHE